MLKPETHRGTERVFADGDFLVHHVVGEVVRSVMIQNPESRKNQHCLNEEMRQHCDVVRGITDP